MTPRPEDYDPVEAELVRESLENLSEEMAVTLKRTSGSPVVTDAHDFSTAFLDTDGDLLGFSGFIMIHMGSSILGTRTVLEEQAEEVEPGVGFIANDPHTTGALHQGDIGIVMPFFHEGDHVGWGFANEHVSDVGGSSISGMAPQARDCFSEALRFPGNLFMRDGQILPEWKQFIANNVRTPDLVINDIRSMIAGNNVGQQKLIDLIDTVGRETFEKYNEVNKGLSERALRDRVEDLPDGVYETDEWDEYDGKGSDDVYRIRGRLEVDGDELRFAFTGDPQVDAFINGTEGAVLGMLMSVVKIRIAHDLPVNHGLIRPVEVDLGEPGTVVNARPPAPVTQSHMQTGMQISKMVSDLLCEAMAHSSNESLRRRVSGQAVECGACGLWFGQNQYDQPTVHFPLSSANGMGGGAKTTHDGMDAYGVTGGIGSSFPDVEIYESRQPVLYLWRKINRNSGGPGYHRGGQGLREAFTPYGTDRLTGHAYNGVAKLPAGGLFGGYPGSANRFYILRDTNLHDLLEAGHHPIESRLEGTRDQPANFVSGLELAPGEVFVNDEGGGGGLGDPLARPLEAVQADLVDDYITPEHARRVYGAVLEEDGRTLDRAATREKRRKRRRERLACSGDGETGDPIDLSASPALPVTVRETDGDRVWACGRCERILSGIGDSWREVVTHRTHPIDVFYERGEMDVQTLANPPVLLHEYACPTCGLLLDVSVLPEGVRQSPVPRLNLGH